MAAVDVDLMESVQVQVPGALLVVRSIYIAAIIIITGPGGWPRTVGHDLKFESTGGKMMLAPHSARRVETRRAE